MPPRLVVRPGTREEQAFPLKAGPNAIGRTTENDVCLSHASLSRAHAQIDVTDAAVVLRDLGSKNGTFVDGARITTRTLGEAHTIKFGELETSYTRGKAPSLWPEVAPTPAITRSIAADVTRLSLGEVVNMNATGGWSASPTVVARSDNDSDRLRILLKVSQLLSSPSSLDDLLTSVLDLAFEILDIDRAAVLMPDPQTGVLVPRVARVRKGDRTFSQSIARYVMDRSVAALFSNATSDPRLAHAGSVVMQAIRTSMCAPLKPRDTMLGVLYVDNLTHPARFNAEDLEFLSAFANQAAVAIDNSLLHAKLAGEAVARNNLLRFFPPTAVPALIEDGGAGLRTIEAQAAVLFSDISGYTQMSSTMRPTEIIELLNAYFPVMAEIVFRFDGTLEKYIGDALLAVWGVPTQHEDDSARAVLAAIEMQRAVQRLNELWQGERHIGIHIGVNTGPVAAGNIGSKDYVQYATIGDTTNVASRICGVANRGEIVVDERTATAIRGRGIHLLPLAPTTLRGTTRETSLFRVEWQ